MKEEVWKKVIGFEDYYEVSNTGKVRSISREIDRVINGNYVITGKELIPTIYNGYYSVGLWVNGIKHNK